MSRRRAFRAPSDDGSRPVRDLIVVFSDQLDPRGIDALRLDRRRDVVLMAEIAEEPNRGPSHRQRTALFLAAMRHFAADLTERRYRVDYRTLDHPDNRGSLSAEIAAAVERYKPAKIRALRPGEWPVLQVLERQAQEAALPLEIVEEPHFLETPAAFERWAGSRRQRVLEHFYRRMRKRLGILLDSDGGPEGRRWNFDKENRKPWRRGDPRPPQPIRFSPDAVTREVLQLVAERFPEAPGSLESFGWPVTREQARMALDDFIDQRLTQFGTYQDALPIGKPWMFHSLLSPALNLKLLDPRECVEAALDAYRRRSTPLASVEGFIRQIIGWREFIRGVYWMEGPGYGERNELGQHGRLPSFYWTGETDMNCMKDAVGQVLEHGYGHHIQRLMVTGNFALVSGVSPQEVSAWYLAMYVDAVDWVTLPNVAGMVMYSDGGLVATRPYAASGQYIRRMGDACRGCRFDPGKRSGDGACPITTFYWEFLDRHRERFDQNPRMRPMMSNLGRIEDDEMQAIRSQAARLREELGIGSPAGGEA